MICLKKELTKDNGVETCWRNGHKYAIAVSYHRGGCLYAGFIILKCLNTCWSKEISSTMNWDYHNINDYSPYLESLWEKHFNEKSNRP